MSDPFLSACEMHDQLRDRRSSATELIDASLRRISLQNSSVAAFIEVFEDEARTRANQIDARLAAGNTIGAFAGIPIALKDNFTYAGHRTGCCSKILDGFVSPYDSCAVERLLEGDAVFMGRANMDEFAMGSSTEHSCHGPTRNPFDLERIPGGSSGGSAAAVAAGMVPLALGSDTGGSVRQPAALCGVVGLKPTYGRISRYGLVAFASSLDTVAPVGRSVRDVAFALDALAGVDPRDPTSLDVPVENIARTDLTPEKVARGMAGLRVGIPKEYFGDGLDVQVRQRVSEAVAQLESLGAQLIDVSLPHTELAIPTYYLVATAEASSNLARFDGVRYGHRVGGDADLDSLYRDTRGAGFGDEVQLRVMVGSFSLCSGYYDAYYGKATRVRTLIRRDFEEAFQRCDVLATPTSPFTAFRIGERAGDPLQMYMCDVLTAPANLAGIPALSLPCGFDDAGLPVGLQLLGPALSEARLLQAGAAFEDSTEHHRRRPTP